MVIPDRPLVGHSSRSSADSPSPRPKAKLGHGKTEGQGREGPRGAVPRRDKASEAEAQLRAYHALGRKVLDRIKDGQAGRRHPPRAERGDGPRVRQPPQGPRLRRQVHGRSSSTSCAGCGPPRGCRCPGGTSASS